MFPTMAGENFQIYSAQITGKYIWKTFPPLLHDLIIRTHAKQPSTNFPKKICSPLQSFLRKKSHHTLGVILETLCFTFIYFPISKVLSLTFVVQTMAFQAKLPSFCF